MSDELIRAEFEKVVSSAYLSRGKYRSQDYDRSATQAAWEMWRKCWPIAFAAGQESRPAPEQSRGARDAALDVIAQLMLVGGRHDVDTAREAAEEILAAAMDRSALGREGSDADQA